MPPPERARSRVARIAKGDFLLCHVFPPGSAFVGVQELAGTTRSGGDAAPETIPKPGGVG